MSHSKYIQARPANGHLIHAIPRTAMAQVDSRALRWGQAYVYATALCGVRGMSGMGAGGMRIATPIAPPSFAIDPTWGPPLGSCRRCAQILRKQSPS